jgi:hypothetical protein
MYITLSGAAKQAHCFYGLGFLLTGTFSLFYPGSVSRWFSCFATIINPSVSFNGGATGFVSCAPLLTNCLPDEVIK